MSKLLSALLFCLVSEFNFLVFKEADRYIFNPSPISLSNTSINFSCFSGSSNTRTFDGDLKKSWLDAWYFFSFSS